MNHKPNFFTAGAVALLAFAGLTACASMTQGTSNPRTYAAHGVSFRYPRGWSRGTAGGWVGCCKSRKLWSVAVSPGGGTTADSVDITANRSPGVATRQNLPVITPSIVREARSQFRQLHGELIAGPRAITVGGMPGLRFAGTAKTHGAAKVTEVSAFNGSTEYNIVCSATPAKVRAIQRACAEVVRTFKVSKLFTAGTALVYRAHGVSFRYPPSWAEGTLGNVPAGCGQCKSWSAAVALDRVNGVEVIAHGHQPRVTRRNLPGFTRYVTRFERGEFRYNGGRLLEGPRAITVGGMPGLLYRGTAKIDGTAGKTTAVMVVNGTTDYEISCTSTRAKAPAVHRACTEVLRTFKVARPSRRE